MEVVTCSGGALAKVMERAGEARGARSPGTGGDVESNKNKVFLSSFGREKLRVEGLKAVDRLNDAPNRLRGKLSVESRWCELPHPQVELGEPRCSP